jgi:hypothetical protein
MLAELVDTRFTAITTTTGRIPAGTTGRIPAGMITAPMAAIGSTIPSFVLAGTTTTLAE